MYNIIFYGESIFTMLIFDSLYFFVLLIILSIIIIFLIIKKSFTDDYEDRVVQDFYNDEETDADKVEKLIGSSYAKQFRNNYKGAINDLSNALKLSPNSIKAYILRGKLFIELGDTTKAISDFDTVLKLDPQNETAYFFRGKAKYAEGKVYEASKDFEKAESLGFIYSQK